jgi:hypothetical protein
MTGALPPALRMEVVEWEETANPKARPCMKQNRKDGPAEVIQGTLSLRHPPPVTKRVARLWRSMDLVTAQPCACASG